MKHQNTQPIYIFNRANPQNSEPQSGSRRGLDFIALNFADPEVFLELLNCQAKRTKTGQYFVVARITFNNSPNSYFERSFKSYLLEIFNSDFFEPIFFDNQPNFLLI